MVNNKTKMAHSRRATTTQNSRFTDGEFQPKRPATDSLLMNYLCHFRGKNEISIEEYKEYVGQQLDQIHEINANYSVTKSDGKNYNNVFLTVKIEHVAKNHEFYAIPVCDIEHRSEFQEHLNDVYAYDAFCEPFHEIKAKHLCAAFVDNNWCRGEIVDIITEMQCQVYLLDYGRTVPVKRNNLCLLKFPLALIRPFVIKCQLSVLNGVAMNLCKEFHKELLKQFKKMAKEADDVCIYLNGSISEKSDIYTNVLLLTASQTKFKTQCDMYSLHEAYGAFYRPKLRFDSEMCELWFNNINAMEKIINSNNAKRVQVFLSHICSPTEFYVQCEPVKLFMSKIRRIIDGFGRSKMADYNVDDKDWTIGDDCLVRVQNWKTKADLKLWYRGRIIAAGPQCTFEVFLRDYGRRVTEITRMNLMTISAELAACPNAVQRSTLAISHRWIESSTQLFEEAVAQYDSFAISCVRKVEANMYVDFWATNSKSPDVEDFDRWHNIGYITICLNIRQSMQPFILESQHRYNTSKRIEDEKNSSVICLSSEDDFSKNSANLTRANDDEKNDDDVYVIKGDLLTHEPIASKWLEPIRMDRDTFRGMVTHITERGIIYVQEESNCDLAHDISASISSRMMKIRDDVHISREWKVGDTCFAEYERNQYHRAVVKRIYREHGTSLVKYVDFGTKLILKLEDLQLATMFIDLPMLAHRCFIPHVQSNSKNGKWSPGILQEFKKQILLEFCAIRVHGLAYKNIIPCTIDPIYQPHDAYKWLRKEKLVNHTGIDAENDEILYVS